MATASVRTMLMAIALVCFTSALGQGIPSPQECRRRVDSIGENNLLQQLSSCQGSTPRAECCNKARALLGFPGSGQLAGCLCNAENLELTLSTIENNALARLAGVNRDAVQSTLNQCRVANVKLAGSCPGAGGADEEDMTGPATSPEDSDNTGGTPDNGNNEDNMGGPKADTGKTGPVATGKTPGHGFKHPFLHKHPILSALVRGGSGGDGDRSSTKGHHGHWLAGGRRLLTVEVTAPFTNVAVGKDGVDVKAPGTDVQVKKPVGDDARKSVTKARKAGDAKGDAANKLVKGDGKGKSMKVHRFHHHDKGMPIVKQAVAVHTAIHKAFTDAVTAHLAAAAKIHKAKSDAVRRHVAGHVSKSG